MPDPCGLEALPIGVPARIVDVGDRGTAPYSGRLGDLGFVTGARIELLRRAPVGDPAVYRVRGYDICLRAAQARGIRVTTTL
ncbi:FeoA family protein [Cryobacterium algoricola]|uniref:FeoA family protein n=1 Tax=Cryobacterium algoricola TaxID=1259183 RepID=UPI001F53EBFA|nr:FeoA family protein [Cryobacterium algoricola]